MIRPKEDVERILAPFQVRIRNVVKCALGEWLAVKRFSTDRGRGAPLYPRTAANYIFDAAIREAQAEFGDDPNVRIFSEAQTAKFLFARDVIVRFKKGDEAGLGRNILTQAVMDFLDPQQALPGLPPAAVKVEIVWKLNDIETEIAELLVVARDGDRAIWAYPIDLSEGSVVEIPGREEEDDDLPLVATKRRVDRVKEGGV